MFYVLGLNFYFELFFYLTRLCCIMIVGERKRMKTEAVLNTDAMVTIVVSGWLATS